MGHATPTPFRKRIKTSFAVLSMIGMATLVVSTPLYFLGKQVENDRRFLPNYRSPSIQEMEIKIRMNYVLESQEENDVLFIGDSSCYFGISPKLFTKCTGLQSYNLGIPGASIPRTFQLILRKYLENHPKPKAIVICYSPRWLSGIRPLDDREVSDRFLWCYSQGTEEARPPQRYFLYSYIMSGGHYLVGQFLGGLQAQLDKPIQGFNHPDATYNKQKRLRDAARGFFEWKDRSWYHSTFTIKQDAPFAMTTANEEALCEFARFCADNGVVLLVRLAPCHEGAAPNDWPSLTRSVEELSKSTFCKVTFSLPLVLRYPKEWMGDIRHCNAQGAEQFTRLVAEEVEKVLKK